MFNYTLLDAGQCEFVSVGPVDELRDGERFFVEIEDLEIVVFRIAGEFFAIADLCSHDDGPLGEGEMENHDVVCPRHGAHFDVRSGKAVSLPAIVDIPAYPVRIIAGQLEIGIPLDN